MIDTCVPPIQIVASFPDCLAGLDVRPGLDARFPNEVRLSLVPSQPPRGTFSMSSHTNGLRFGILAAACQAPGVIGSALTGWPGVM